MIYEDDLLEIDKLNEVVDAAKEFLNNIKLFEYSPSVEMSLTDECLDLINMVNKQIAYQKKLIEYNNSLIKTKNYEK